MAAKKSAVVVRVGGPESGLSVAVSDGARKPKTAKELQQEAARTAELNRSTKVIVRGGEQVDSLPDHLKAGVRTAQEALVALLPDTPREAKSIFVDPETRTLSIAAGDVTVNAGGSYVFSMHQETTTSGLWRWKRTETESTNGEGMITRVVIPDPQDERAAGHGILAADAIMAGFKVLVHDYFSGTRWEERHGQVERVVAEAIKRGIPTVYAKAERPEANGRRGLVGYQTEQLIDQLQIGRTKSSDADKVEDTKRALRQEGLVSSDGVILVLGDGASTKIIAPLGEADADPSLIRIEGVNERWQIEGKKRVKESKEKRDKETKPVVVRAAEPTASQLSDMTLADIAATFLGDQEILTRGIKVVPPVEAAGFWTSVSSTDKDEKVRHTVTGDHMRTIIADKAKAQTKRTGQIRTREISLSDLVEGERIDPTELVIGLGVARASRTERGGDDFNFASIFNTDSQAIRTGNKIVIELVSEIAKHKVRGVSDNVIATGILFDRFAPKTDAEKRAVRELAEFFAPKTESERESEKDRVQKNKRRRVKRGPEFRMADARADFISVQAVTDSLTVLDPFTGQARLLDPEYAPELLTSMGIPAEYQTDVINRVYGRNDFVVVASEQPESDTIAIDGGKSGKRRHKKRNGGQPDSVENTVDLPNGSTVTVIVGGESANGYHKNGRRS